MANVTPSSPFKKQKVDDLGEDRRSDATRRGLPHESANNDQAAAQAPAPAPAPNANAPSTSPTRMTAAVLSSPSSPTSFPFPKFFDKWNASDDDKISITRTFGSLRGFFEDLMKLLDAKNNIIGNLQATVEELEATNKKLRGTVENQRKELEKYKCLSNTENLIKNAVDKVTADMHTIEKMTADSQTILRSLLP